MKLSVNALLQPADPEAIRFVLDAQRDGAPARVGAVALSGVLLCVWLPWYLALGWAAIVIAWDVVVAQRVFERRIRRMLDTDPHGAEVLGVLSCVLASVLYSSGLIMVGATTGAGLLAGLWFGLTLIHALVYFSRVGRWLLACILPMSIATAITGFLQDLALVQAISISLFVVQGVAVVLLAANDRNRLVRMLDEQSSARQAAEDASTAKSQFLANMSHELRTPLNAVIGYAEILEEDLDADGRGANAADANRIRKAARHLLGLINEVLDLSKIEAGRMEVVLAPCDVAQLVADAVEQARPAAEANGNTIHVSMPALAPVVADGGKLGQCLLNFLSNAAKFTENGRINVGVALENGVLRFDVADTGCGIAAEASRRLFQPFTQVDASFTRRAGGTGLGLVITRRLAELMGGDVSFVSAPGEGSIFTLRVAVESVANEEGPTRPCVLVVEDEASARDLTRRALAALPFDVRMATTVAEGLAAFRTLDPALVVLDVHLPDGAGWEVLAEIRCMRPATPVLVVTIDDDRARALALGASEHLIKPVDRDRIAAAALRLTVAARAAA